jgi:hypothetical protein
VSTEIRGEILVEDTDSPSFSGPRSILGPYPVDRGEALSPVIKQPERKTDHVPYLVPTLRMREGTPPHTWCLIRHKVYLVRGTLRSRDRSVSITTSYGPDGRGSIPGMGKIFFSTPQLPEWSGAKPASHSTSTAGSFPRG